MRKYNRSQRQYNWQPRPLSRPSDPTEDAIRSYADNRVNTPPSQPYAVTMLHSINGVRLSRYWRTEPYNKGFTYELTWRDHYWAGHSAEEVFKKARDTFPRPPHVGEILAVRGWSLKGDVLTSIGGADWQDSSRIWTGPIMHADRKPEMGNSSGLYAVKAEPQPITWLLRAYSPDVYGFVGMYGQIVELTSGWRAEHMVVRRLILRMPASPQFVNLLANRYDCDVVIEKKYRT